MIEKPMLQIFIYATGWTIVAAIIATAMYFCYRTIQELKNLFNLPFHRIHDGQHSYGRIICPTWISAKYDRRPGSIKWIAYFDCYGMKLTDDYGFHNCTITKVY